ncbi:hypothetical protein POM88_033414 [Heracleum sosnowskyi]|uniref:F-box associated beta-propeller type 3 domain-containing protein n=1 Tax=Heracleum sosnowskyi TaxID=360622 RepID=A0AAD8MKZ2_9APIA|nr:hypothetical protein POM88_033414 [Heracleum sosnowskyi]
MSDVPPEIINIILSPALCETVEKDRGFSVDVDAQIVSFDLATEEYGLIQLPEFLDRNCLITVGELGGRLCLYCNHHMDYNLDIWVMNSYGVKESWTKLLISVQIPEVKFTQFNVYLLHDKQVLCMQGRTLRWFDPKLRMMTCFRLLAIPECFRSYLCLGSLVKLSDGARTDASLN